MAEEEAAAVDTDEQGEDHGSEDVSAGLLDDANERATVSRALDAAMQSFGLQTNQQINIFGTGSAGAAIRRTVLPDRTLLRTRTAFVRPGGYRRLWEQLDDRHLIILSSGRGWGARHAATCALDALCGGRVHHLTSGTIADLRVADLTEGAGYLWTDLQASGDDLLETHQVDGLAEALRSRGSRMVIVSPPDVEWPFQLNELRCDLTGPPDLDLVVRLYLRADDESDAPADDVLSHPAVAEARARLTSADAAARLGTALREVVNGRVAPEEAIRNAGAVTERTADWFAGLPEREDRALALALATLDGLSYPTVLSAARDLDELIQRAEDPKKRSSVRPFVRPARQLLEAVQANTSPARLETSYGIVPITMIASRRPEFPREMLATMWSDYPYLQEIYLGWLGALVQSPDPYVRERAAVATGILAQSDFDFVHGRVLIDWATSDDRDIRRAAGVALRVPAMNDKLCDIVWKMLDAWSVEKKDRPETDTEYRRRMTAASALGGPVGMLDVGRSLNLITDRLLEYSPAYSYPYWWTIGNAVVELFADGGSEQSTAVLDRMQEWARTTRTTHVNVAIVALVGIVGRPAQGGDDDERRVPPVLRATASDDNLKRVAGLWRLALNHRVMSKAATRALLRLARNLDDSEESATAFLGLVTTVPRSPRELRTLLYETRMWIKDDPHPAILDRLYDQLRDMEVPDEPARRL